MSGRDEFGAVARTPRERWGTCCPFDPECEHSYLDEDELIRWMDSPLPEPHAYDEGAKP